MASYIETYSGKQIDFYDPQPDQIDIKDIALGLSRMPRFSGQTKWFYSVAHHSLNVAHYLPKKYKLMGLLHDAAEAYIGDMPTPFKRNIPDFAALEQRIWCAICRKLGLNATLPELVKRADQIMLVSERDILKPAITDWGDYEENVRVPLHYSHTWTENQVYNKFLELFAELYAAAKQENPASYT